MNEKLHEIFEELKETDLKDLDKSIREKDMSIEEKEFRIALYNYFLQQKQKEIVNSEFRM